MMEQRGINTLLVHGRRRSKIEMMLDLLWACDTPVPLTKTKIYYRSNLNFQTLKELSSRLIERGLLTKRLLGKNTTVFKTTEKGRTLLSSYYNILDELGEKKYC